VIKNNIFQRGPNRQCESLVSTSCSIRVASATKQRLDRLSFYPMGRYRRVGSRSNGLRKRTSEPPRCFSTMEIKSANSLPINPLVHLVWMNYIRWGLVKPCLSVRTRCCPRGKPSGPLHVPSGDIFRNRRGYPMRQPAKI